MKGRKFMKRPNKNIQLKSGNLSSSRSRHPPRAGRSECARPGLPRDLEDWLQSEREQWIEKVLLSWHHPNFQTCDGGEPAF
jgi:hypothetical protein